MAEKKDFSSFLEDKKLPICVLDQKWHRLFAVQGKPEHIAQCEQELDEYLQKQGKLQNELKELKKMKAKLMSSIVANMEGTYIENEGRSSSKKLDANKQMLDEINEKMEQHEDLLIDLPREIDRVNKELMLYTIEYCYEKFRINISEVREIADWITQVRIELKKNIIKKQNREVNSRQIYAYMHDIFGAEMMDVFDLDNGDVDLRVLEPPKKKEQTVSNEKKASDGSVSVRGEAEHAQAQKENFDTDEQG